MIPRGTNQIYREHIIDHYRNPRNFGSLKSCDMRRRESNFSCGDDLEFFLTIKKNKITDVRFQGEGCALSVAASSMLGEKVIGMSVGALEKMENQDIVKMLGVGELHGSRLRCATLGLKGLQTGLKEWKNKNIKKK